MQNVLTMDGVSVKVYFNLPEITTFIKNNRIFVNTLPCSHADMCEICFYRPKIKSIVCVYECMFYSSFVLSFSLQYMTGQCTSFAAVTI